MKRYMNADKAKGLYDKLKPFVRILKDSYGFKPTPIMSKTVYWAPGWGRELMFEEFLDLYGLAIERRQAI